MDIANSTRQRTLREPLSALALFAGGLAWIAAFWLPTFYTSQGVVEGYWVFATGWMGFTVLQFAWYANLLMLLSVTIMYSSPIWSAGLAGLGVIIATQAFWFNAIPSGEVDMPILHLGTGFWCWYGSMLLLGLGVFLGSEQTDAEQDQITEQSSIVIPEPRSTKVLTQTKVEPLTPPVQNPALLTTTSAALLAPIEQAQGKEDQLIELKPIDSTHVSADPLDTVNVSEPLIAPTVISTEPVSEPRGLVAQEPLLIQASLTQNVAVDLQPVEVFPSVDESHNPEQAAQVIVAPAETVLANEMNEAESSLELTKPTPFVPVPEPESPNFAELAAANEQDYFQQPNEVALKPVYTNQLAEDWPPKMSLVVTPDPFGTDPNLTKLKTEESTASSEEDSPTASSAPKLVKQSNASFFDPWKA